MLKVWGYITFVWLKWNEWKDEGVWFVRKDKNMDDGSELTGNRFRRSCEMELDEKGWDERVRREVGGVRVTLLWERRRGGVVPIDKTGFKA